MNAQKMFEEIEQQRNIAFSRCAQMAGTIGDLEERIKALEEQLKPKEKEENVKSIRPEKE
jgi:hypothetical protein